MTDVRAAAEPYTTTFEATVEGIDGREVVLDRTYFYPEGGGQPPDRGTIAGVDVVDVQADGDDVVHALAAAPGLAAGDAALCKVDREFRTYCMRAHTASHALYGAGRRVLEDLDYGGFGITEGKVRVDFTTPTDIDDEVLVELERLVNRAVWDSREVSWETLPEEEALATEDIAFNAATEEGIEGRTVRVVTIEGWDVAACGGTHVRNTREIGPVTVLDRSNPGEGLTRVEFTVGPAGIERRAEEKRALRDAARATDAAPTDLPDAVERLHDEVADLEAEVADLRADRVETRLAELRDETVERDGAEWLAGVIEGHDANALGERARDLAGDAADVVALAGRDGRTFVAVAATDGDADAVIGTVTEEFGGGGGGSADLAQAGGIEAPPEEVAAFLRGEEGKPGSDPDA